MAFNLAARMFRFSVELTEFEEFITALAGRDFVKLGISSKIRNQ
jgi:hypothetical protein